jgi:hypothetical protein
MDGGEEKKEGGGGISVSENRERNRWEEQQYHVGL